MTTEGATSTAVILQVARWLLCAVRSTELN